SPGKWEATTASLEEVRSDEQFRNYLESAGESMASHNYAQAEQQFSQAVEEGQRLGLDAGKLAPIVYRLARAQDIPGKVDQAFSNYKRALELADRVSSGDYELLDSILSRLGFISHLRQDDEAALAYFTRQVQLRRIHICPRSGKVGETLVALS